MKKYLLLILFVVSVSAKVGSGGNAMRAEMEKQLIRKGIINSGDNIWRF